MFSRLLLFGLCLSTLLLLPAKSTAQPERESNIIVIVADDLGFGDLSIHDSPDLKTPNIDAHLNTAGT